MKAFVIDDGWAGAEIFFSQSYQKAYEALVYPRRADALYMIWQHIEAKSGPTPEYFYRDLDRWTDSKKSWAEIKIFDVGEGLTIHTEGG